MIATKASAKRATVARLCDGFNTADSVIVTEYRGLAVSEMKTLRRALGADVEYVVAKNTLLRRAANECGIQSLDEEFSGPVAVAFVKGEAVKAAKVFKDFSKDNQHFVLKAGYIDGLVLDTAGVEHLATLESREVLLAKFAGAAKATAAAAAAVFMAPIQKFAATANALVNSKK